ncbi:hypothetical protein ACWGDT_20810 [Streptomyces avermitilis]
MSALAQARDGKLISEDFVVFLENTTQQLAAFATEQRQHTAALLDSHLSTVSELPEHTGVIVKFCGPRGSGDVL